MDVKEQALQKSMNNFVQGIRELTVLVKDTQEFASGVA
jgi:hypothetical protein